jgi:hypothetical protein
MTYVSGQLIQATDYNGFVNDTVGANINATWSTGTTDAGYGQSALTTVSPADRKSTRLNSSHISLPHISRMPSSA